MKKISPKGISHIMSWEQLRLSVYDDLQPNLKLTSKNDIKGILTIGWGHTGSDVYLGQKISLSEANEYLAKDLVWAQDAVNNLCLDLLQHEFDALVSFVYNTGAKSLKSRSLIKSIGKYVESNRDQLLYSDLFKLWTRYWTFSKGKKLQGLVNRRSSERDLFFS